MRDTIGADVVAWLVSDPETASHWRTLAATLNLDAYVAAIDGDTDASVIPERRRRRHVKLDQHKLQELLDVWRRASPITFTRQKLIEALNKEGLHHMRQWLEIINTENSTRKNEIAEILDRSRSRTTSRSSVSPTASTSSWSPTPTPSLCQTPRASSTPILRSTKPSGGILKTRYEDIDDETRSDRSSSTSTTKDEQRISSPSSLMRGARPKNGSGMKSIRFALDEPKSSEQSPLPLPSTRSSSKIFQPLHMVPRKSEILAVDELDDSSDSGVASADRSFNNGVKNVESTDEIGSNRRVNVDKYFDNLISLIQEAADGIATT